MHTTGGYLLQRRADARKYVFDLKDEDTYWCTADIGWVTGHSYVVYGPLANGATTRDVRGRAELPASPTASGSIIERHRRHASSTPRRPRSARS